VEREERGGMRVVQVIEEWKEKGGGRVAQVPIMSSGSQMVLYR
jgi:hypothetical protein